MGPVLSTVATPVVLAAVALEVAVAAAVAGLLRVVVAVPPPYRSVYAYDNIHHYTIRHSHNRIENQMRSEKAGADAAATMDPTKMRIYYPIGQALPSLTAQSLVLCRALWLVEAASNCVRPAQLSFSCPAALLLFLLIVLAILCISRFFPSHLFKSLPEFVSSDVMSRC